MKLLQDEAPADEDGTNHPDDQVICAAPQLRPDHAVALQVLRGSVGIAAPHDITRKFTVAAGGRVGTITVTFDNSSHSSGHQRGYVSCSRGMRGACGHQVSFQTDASKCIYAIALIYVSNASDACFLLSCEARHKYAVLHRFDSDHDCVAWLAGWSEAGKLQPGAFTKADHKEFVPSAERVAELKGLITEMEG